MGVTLTGTHLTKEFACWIFDYDERFEGKGEEISTLLPNFAFSSADITLDEHHGEDVKTGLRQAMEYITAECDQETILQQPFIKDNMYLIKQLTEHTGNEPVHLFDFKLESTSTYTKKKKFDELTWNGEDYSDLAVDIICCIVNHANHQQRRENYVKQRVSFLRQILARPGVQFGQSLLAPLFGGSMHGV